MKHIVFLLFTFILSPTFAGEDNYSGIWKDNQGVHYSIHQSSNSIVIGEMSSNKIDIYPAEQGVIDFTDTNTDLDLAIEGYGFFILESSDGTYSYTRNGKFHLSSNNTIVSERGERLVTKNKLSIPETTDGMTPILKEEPLECHYLFGCSPEIIETRKIIIEPDGSIRLYDSETKEVFEFDRILLANIPIEQINFSGYPISLEDKESVSFFYPSETKSISRNTFIRQGGLESLVYNQKTWKGYSGILTGKKAKLSLIDTSNNDSPDNKEIIFESKFIGTIKSECLSDPKICAIIDDLQDKKFIKVY